METLNIVFVSKVLLFSLHPLKMLQKICKATEKLFMKYGIKSITMDDVAKESSISKKTLYLYVKDKNDLVQKTITLHLGIVYGICDGIMKEKENAISQIFNVAEMMISLHKDVNPALIYDLKKYHPDSYSIFKEHRERMMFMQVIENLKFGIEQNLFRSDIDLELTAGFYMGLIDQCLNPEIEVLTKTSFQVKYQYLIVYHLNAISTEEGKKLITPFNKN